MNNGGGGDVEILEAEPDALKQFPSEREPAVARRFVFEDLPNAFSHSHTTPNVAAVPRTSRLPTREIATAITRARLVALWQRRCAQALDTCVRSRSALASRLERPVAIGFACGVGVGVFMIQLLPTPSLTPSVEAMAPARSALVVEAAKPPAQPVATTPAPQPVATLPVAETPEAVDVPPPPASPRPASPSRPRYQGSLRIGSQPASAVVFVNNQRVGETPLVLKSLPVGSRAVRLELSGYAPWSRSIQIVADRPAIVEADLSPISH